MKKFKHKDAYRLVTYYCFYCKKTEYIWNSRDMECFDRIHCSECDSPIPKVTRHQGKYRGPQIPELTPLGLRWFIVETEELYTARIKKQIKEMADDLFKDTTRKIVEKSLIEAFIPDQIRLVDPLTLNFEGQVQVLLSDN